MWRIDCLLKCALDVVASWAQVVVRRLSSLTCNLLCRFLVCGLVGRLRSSNCNLLCHSLICGLNLLCRSLICSLVGCSLIVVVASVTVNDTKRYFIVSENIVAVKSSFVVVVVVV